jgi:hypothetical protein
MFGKTNLVSSFPLYLDVQVRLFEPHMLRQHFITVYNRGIRLPASFDSALRTKHKSHATCVLLLSKCGLKLSIQMYIYLAPLSLRVSYASKGKLLLFKRPD